MKINKKLIKDIKKYHKISGPIRKKISSEDFTKSNEDFSKIFFILSVLSPQQWSTRIQSIVNSKLNLLNVPSAEGRGDSVDNEGNYYEIKCSIITDINKTLNMVQIRPWEDLKGYIFCALDIRDDKIDLYKFYLSKEDILLELEQMGHSAHGGKIIAGKNLNHERAIRLKIDVDNEHFKRWIKKYSKNNFLKMLK